MGCALLDCCFYCFWSTVTFIGCAIVYVVTGKEKETFLSQNELKFWKLSIRFVYKLMRHRKQGVLTIPDSLRYVAEGGDERCSLKISPNNHKVSVKNLRYLRYQWLLLANWLSVLVSFSASVSFIVRLSEKKYGYKIDQRTCFIFSQARQGPYSAIHQLVG